MFKVAFWKDAIERSLKSGAQFLIGAWGIGDGMFDLFAVDVKLGFSVFAGGAVLSLLTSLASAPFGNTQTASLVV